MEVSDYIAEAEAYALHAQDQIQKAMEAMSQASDVADQSPEDVCEEAKDSYGKTRKDYFVMELQNMGLFVREYDKASVDSLYEAADHLHHVLSRLDSHNIKEWIDLPLVELVNAFAKLEDLSLITRTKEK